MSDIASMSQSATTTLYSFANHDRSARLRWLMLEMKLPFEESRLDFSSAEHRGPEFRSISPFALIPGLRHGDLSLFDSGAILLTLLERHPNDLAPPPGDDARPRFLSWLFALCASLDPYAIDLFFALKDGAPDQHVNKLQTKVAHRLEVLDQTLADRPFLLGEQFSACDIVLGHLLGILQRVNQLEAFPSLKGYLKRLMERPAAQEADLFKGVEVS